MGEQFVNAEGGMADCRPPKYATRLLFFIFVAIILFTALS